MIRLFNENGGETRTEAGNAYSGEVYFHLLELIQRARMLGYSLRDAQVLITDELNCLIAEELIKAGVKERAAQRLADASLYNEKDYEGEGGYRTTLC